MSPNTHNVPTLTFRYILFPYNTALASCIPDGVNGIFQPLTKMSTRCRFWG